MGGFLIVKNHESIDAAEMDAQYLDSLDVFVKKQLPLNKKIITDTHSIFVYFKRQYKEENTLQLDANNFIVSTGTFIYKQKMGILALEKAYADFDEHKGLCFSDVSGVGAVILFKYGKLFVFNDYPGLYRVYKNKENSVISSSFLAVLNSLKSKTIAKQELYEYILDGACYGDKSFIKEIDLINGSNILQVHPESQCITKQKNEEPLKSNISFDEAIKEVSENLTRYFNVLKSNFGDSVCSALSGGLDSRLMLAVMRRVGIKPYSYVYGHVNSKDVQVSQAIAKGESINIDHQDKSIFAEYSVNEYTELLEELYYFYDGTSVAGIFDCGSDRATRLDRTSKARLQLNGSSGEIYRNYWNLPIKDYDMRDYLSTNYDFPDYSMLTNEFEKEPFITSIGEKIKKFVGLKGNRISRRQIEMLFPCYRVQYWAGTVNTVNNELAYSIIPYADCRIAMQSINIPLKFKQFTDFEAGLIKYLDPKLAKYPSQYGYNYDDDNNLLPRIKYFIRIHMPTKLKLLIVSLMRKFRKTNVNQTKFPYYLQKKYTDKLFPSGNLNVSQYVNLDKITNPTMLARALSVEIILTNRFGNKDKQQNLLKTCDSSK